MWVAKIKFNGSSALLGSYAKKHKVSLSGYPISYKKNPDYLQTSFIGCIVGEEKNKKKFIKDLNANKRILKIEEKDNLVIGEIKNSVIFESMYNHKNVCLEPVTINEDGIEYWTLGSWKKQDLIEFIDITEKKFNAELVNIFQKDISNFSIISTQPNLTLKQKKAMDIAIKNGYYNYPRKTNLKKLAKIIGCSYSTYQNHLRKAEIKIIPHNFEMNY